METIRRSAATPFPVLARPRKRPTAWRTAWRIHAVFFTDYENGHDIGVMRLGHQMGFVAKSFDMPR